MSESESSPPPADVLAELYAAERAAPAGEGANARAAVRARLAASADATPVANGRRGARRMTKIAVTAALAVGTAAAAATVVVQVTRSQPAAVPVRDGAVAIPIDAIARAHPGMGVAAPSVLDASAPDAPETLDAPGVVESPTALPSPTPVPTRPAPGPIDPTEPDLLKRAWTALSSDDAALALGLSEQDAKLYPHGELAEERAALHIAALAKLGRAGDAAGEASAFLQQYPNSVHRAMVERVTEKETP